MKSSLVRQIVLGWALGEAKAASAHRFVSRSSLSVPVRPLHAHQGGRTRRRKLSNPTHTRAPSVNGHAAAAERAESRAACAVRLLLHRVRFRGAICAITAQTGLRWCSCGSFRPSFHVHGCCLIDLAALDVTPSDPAWKAPWKELYMLLYS